MRLGIFRRFSHLIHRRTKSDSAVLSVAPRIDVIPPSLSLDAVRQSVTSTTPVLNAILPQPPFLSPLLLSSPVAAEPGSGAFRVGASDLAQRISQRASPVVSVSPGSKCRISQEEGTLFRLTTAQKHAAELAAHSSQLKASIEALQVEAGDAEGVARRAKSDLEQARLAANRQKRRSADLELRLSSRRHELAEYESFAQAISSAGITSLSTAHAETSGTKENFEEAVVETIREASTEKAGLWSRIVSLVIGPRAPDTYVNAINMTLQTRQELRHWRRVSHFWRNTAKESVFHADVTPSSSDLSQVQDSLSDERKKAVEELRERRKTLGLNALPSPASDSSVVSSVNLPYCLPESRPSIASVMSAMSSTSSESHSPQPARRLPPLASDLFKQELYSSHSSERFFTGSSQRSLRSVSGSTDTNFSTQLSEKALGKRKAIEPSVSWVSMPPVGSDSNVGSTSSSVVGSSSSDGPLSSLASFNSTSSRLSVPNSQLPPKSYGSEPSYNTFHSAERALESFERICNRFSSGSNIGSLQSISEEASVSSPARNAPRVVVSDSVSFSGGHSARRASMTLADRLEAESSRPTFRLSATPEYIREADVTLVESGSEDSGRCLSSIGHELDVTLIEVAGQSKAEGNEEGEEKKASLLVSVEDVDQAPTPHKKSRLPIFSRIPSRLSKLTMMSASSSKRSFSSFRSRNSSSTISTIASKEIPPPLSAKKVLVPAFKPMLPLRIVKKTTRT